MLFEDPWKAMGWSCGGCPPSDGGGDNRGDGDCGNAFETEVVQITNAERGLFRQQVACNSEVGAVARAYSQLMCDLSCATRGTCSHNLNGDPGDRLDAAGIEWWRYGENIAWGQNTPADVMRAWMNSSGHRKNILHEEVNTLGVGFVDCGDGYEYWTQVFVRLE